MSSGTQVNMDWARTGVAAGGAGDSSAGAAAPGTGVAGSGYLTDEEILGIEQVDIAAPSGNSVILSEAKNLSSISDDHEATGKRDSSGKGGPQNDRQNAFAERAESSPMPDWMIAAAADPKIAGEARALWAEHQEFRAAFASPVEARAVADEARAIKELLPGGIRDAVSLREATASVERIDAALFSGDVRAQSEVVAEMARTNPAAFRSMFAEAARVLAGMGTSLPKVVGSGNGHTTGPTLRENREGWGTQTEHPNQNLNQNQNQIQNQIQDSRQDAGATNSVNHPSPQLRASASQATEHGSPQFDAAAYAAFERSTNDVVARDVRGSISETLSRVMPEGVADGAAKRIGEDIFTEVHRALAADRALSEQVAGVLRDRRFGSAEQQRVAALVAGRAKQMVPSVARRVIGEWTGTVLNTARSKAARQATAASRVDIAAPGGSSDSLPLRAMSAREVNYASMSDEQILGM